MDDRLGSSDDLDVGSDRLACSFGNFDDNLRRQFPMTISDDNFRGLFHFFGKPLSLSLPRTLSLETLLLQGP